MMVRSCGEKGGDICRVKDAGNGATNQERREGLDHKDGTWITSERT